jgi:uncharacterized metal-binding protein YceD (DUF177 family)
MEKEFKIYTDRLKHGESLSIDFAADPGFLQVEEPELSFRVPIDVKGEAYLADQELVLSLNISTKATIPCSVCNQKIAYPIRVEKFYFTRPLSEIPSHVFDFSETVREAVLLEVPFIVECHGGNCPERKEIAKFLAPPRTSDQDTGEGAHGWQPFKDL